MLPTGDNSELFKEHKQFYEDWTRKPFIDLVVIDRDEQCPTDYEPVLNRSWPGSYDLCIGSNSIFLKQANEDGCPDGTTLV